MILRLSLMTTKNSMNQDVSYLICYGQLEILNNNHSFIVKLLSLQGPLKDNGIIVKYVYIQYY